MSNGASHEEQYQSWLRSQEIKGRDIPLEGEIRNLGNGDPCITHEKVNCNECIQFKKFTPDGVIR